jgi:glycosyltransferase involved in cell wall biosynthesis
MIKKLGLAEVEMFSEYDSTREEVEHVWQWCDMVVSQSPAGVQSVALTMKYQEKGKVVVADYDDLVYSCSPFNPAYKTLGLREVKVKDVQGREQWLWQDGVKGFSIKDNYCRFRSQQDLFKIIDGVSVTNQTLLDKYLEDNPQLSEKMAILPNSINFDLFLPFPRRVSKRIRIGWFASSSHLNEIWMIKDIFKKLFKKYGDKVVFVLLGDIIELKKAFTPQEMEYHTFVDLGIYPLKIASLNLDIGISPLVDDEFNRHKSQLKWSEYSALKIPAVCSDSLPYSCIEDGKTGFLAKNEDAFVEKISKLIESEQLRKEIAQNAYDKNYSDFNLEKNIHLWVEFYERMYEKACVH